MKERIKIAFSVLHILYHIFFYYCYYTSLLTTTTLVPLLFFSTLEAAGIFVKWKPGFLRTGFLQLSPSWFFSCRHHMIMIIVVLHTFLLCIYDTYIPYYDFHLCTFIARFPTITTNFCAWTHCSVGILPVLTLLLFNIYNFLYSSLPIPCDKIRLLVIFPFFSLNCWLTLLSCEWTWMQRDILVLCFHSTNSSIYILILSKKRSTMRSDYSNTFSIFTSCLVPTTRYHVWMKSVCLHLYK